MSFLSELYAEGGEIEALAQACFVEIGDEVFRSIVDGSQLTGAPGQPVRTGHLRSSWVERLTTPTQIRVETDDLPKAQFIEEDARGIHFKSGGPHSIKLTVAGFQNIVDAIAPSHGFSGAAA